MAPKLPFVKLPKGHTLICVSGFGRHAVRSDLAEWVARNLPGVPAAAQQSLRPLYLPAAPVLRSGEWSVVVAQAMAAKVAESRRHLGRVRRLAPEEAAPHLAVSEIVASRPTVGISGLPYRAGEAAVRDFMAGFGVELVSLVRGTSVPVEAALEDQRNSKRFRRRTVLREMRAPRPKPLAVGAVVRLANGEDVQRAVVELDRTFLANARVEVVAME